MAKKTEYVLYRDTKLTKKAKEIFGSTVEGGYTAMHNFETDSKQEKVKELKAMAKDAIEEKEINLDSKTIVIKFNDGRMLKFMSSEWGSISFFNATFEEIFED